MLKLKCRRAAAAKHPFFGLAGEWELARSRARIQTLKSMDLVVRTPTIRIPQLYRSSHIQPSKIKRPFSDKGACFAPAASFIRKAGAYTAQKAIIGLPRDPLQFRPENWNMTTLPSQNTRHKESLHESP